MRHSTDGEQHSVNQRGSRFLLLCYPADWASATHGPGMGHCPKLVCHPSLMTTVLSACTYLAFVTRGQKVCYLRMCQTREIPGQAAPKRFFRNTYGPRYFTRVPPQKTTRSDTCRPCHTSPIHSNPQSRPRCLCREGREGGTWRGEIRGKTQKKN